MQKRLWIVALSLLATPVTKSWAATRQFPSTLQGSHTNSNTALSAVPREQSSACTTGSDGVKVCKSVTPPLAADNNFLVEALDKISFDNYHLLWSPSFMKRTIASVATLFVFRFTHTWTDGFSGWFGWATASPFIANVANNIVLPLIASACCMLQLLINILAGGCAGFNTVLGPIRPYSLGLLFYLTATTTPRGNHKLLTHSLRWSVALMPEGLHFWNAFVRRRRVADRLDHHELLASAAAPISATIQLDIPSMGCVACISNIDSALQVRKENVRVVEAASALYPFGRKGGEAVIRVEALTERHVDEIVDDLIEAVEKAGFEGASVASVRKIINSK